jgi:hypothetical protein
LDVNEVKKMRVKQFNVTNVLILAVLALYYVIMNVLNVTFTQLFIVIGVMLLIQSVYGLIKGDNPKSFIPIFEKIAIYEKQKMGREWVKQRRMSYVWNLILSGYMFLQAYWHQVSPNVLKIDFFLMMLVTISILIVVNIGLVIHIRKVDSSTSENDMKGYTWKSNLIALVIGAVLGVAMFVMTIWYVILGI